ncbi:MAG: hypothetical protein II712_01665, partial [Erysipelotrichaceae bacterium]|nr:hypothetical protein [Erysipelotrichaceae bacterium]
GALNMGGQSQYSEEELNAPSHCMILADQKKAEKDYRFPLIQNSGLLDGLGTNGWPIDNAGNIWLQTFDYWKKYNNIPLTEFKVNDEYPTGITADESFYECEDERFIHHKWYSADPEHLPLYQVLVAKRMPHALDLRQIEIAWEFMKHYSRKADGTLVYTENV